MRRIQSGTVTFRTRRGNVRNGATTPVETVAPNLYLNLPGTVARLAREINNRLIFDGGSGNGRGHVIVG